MIHVYRANSLSIEELYNFAAKSFKKELENMPVARLFYFDSENDKIELTNNEDLNSLFESATNSNKVPKIYIQTTEEEA